MIIVRSYNSQNEHGDEEKTEKKVTWKLFN